MTPVQQAFITDNPEIIAGYRDSKDKVGKWADQLKADFGDHEIYTAWGFCGFGFRGEPLPGWKRNRDWKHQEIYYPDRRTTAGKEAYAKTAQIRCCGNSVCPQVAEAIVRANYVPGELPMRRSRQRMAVGQGVLL